ncbi:MAG: GNAT family N-acetyltransferase [Burkholderiaceae bacterium]
MTSAVLVVALGTLGRGDEHLLVGRIDGRIVAMLVLARLGRWRWQTFQPSQLPLGAFVALPGLSVPRLAKSLLRHCPGFALVLSLTQLDPWSMAREGDTHDASQRDYIETGWIDIDGSFDDYWDARGKNLRQNMKKQRAKLANDGIHVETRVLTDEIDMAAAIERYSALESAGWKAAGGTAIRSDNAQGRFYRHLFERAAQRGEAVVYECLFDGRTVAMNLCLNRDGTLVVLKTTYDESIRSCSPAFLLNREVLEAIFNEGSVRRLEYYGRLMEWHTRWTANKRVLYHCTAYRWPVLKQLAELRARLHVRSDGTSTGPHPAHAP